jgi:hypothetical protein
MAYNCATAYSNIDKSSQVQTNSSIPKEFFLLYCVVKEEWSSQFLQDFSQTLPFGF